MKTLITAVTSIVLLSTAPALAMSCCGGGKGKAPMCGKGSMAMNHGMKGTKGKKAGCCCEGMPSNMSKRG